MQNVEATAAQSEIVFKMFQQVQSTDGAFAAILRDGTVVTWGDLDLLS